MYRVGKDQPYTYSSQMVADKEKLNTLLKEYQSIPNIIVNEGTMIMKKHLSFSNGMYELRYSPEKDRWDVYQGSIYLTSNVKFPDEETAIATHTTVNSDNYGQPVDHQYTFKCQSTPDPIVEASKPIPCSKVIEGIAAIPCTDREYMKKMGYVWDETYKRYRKQTPDEFCATLKSVKEPVKPTKKGIHFGRILSGKNKK